ncbi:ATP-dependent DNA helicase RecG [Bartonella bacilliformis str. Heidi Mejia]|uniref:ATP-dependent DNA helicase RecG n=1 Tax=Bartonella bacilliformis TaxID=774 RepID=UPI00044B046F|nr:ATP-dependent DNA helicase RecG [Bartonella bacilliformis]EYS92009.1 ATP-dependent DNA helicase RecG [Bartonella bacilliformis str. Heidi Mejia]KEG18919.1 ATP-dependent DNA helicase RecG [Bartonella bacilliformis Hosp800-02]KEG23431.1 ATP-dependent DNA helicase RecG [Bartonella bacilliformis VAB9028]KEG24376.1 ATP-dependent DNA helicase RecG [Bartonella bacilliformis CAR600-02]
MCLNLINPLLSSIRTLPGITPKICALLAKVLNIDLAQREPQLIDLLQLMPHSVIDRRMQPSIACAQEGQIVTLKITIDQHQPPPTNLKSLPYRVIGHDETGQINLVFFHARSSWLKTQLPEGKTVIVSGKIERFNKQLSMVHPDHIAFSEEFNQIPLIEPIYPSTAGLSAKTLRRVVQNALEHVPFLPEWIDESVKKQQNFSSFSVALRCIHDPIDPCHLSVESTARKRLAYDELLACQLALGLVRLQTKSLTGVSRLSTGTYTEKLLKSLPFQLTNGQKKTIKEIANDLASPEPMLRLLQGDVGTGKTVVALMAIAQIAENLGQSALMAPTEVLARQHFSTIAPLAEKIGLQTTLLTGREKGKTRTNILNDISSGHASIIIGTHALIQENVTYHNLSLAIIDEQHRFGVHQRLALTAKGHKPDMLVMTATPIPRTLVLTTFGDMDVSKITEKPIGRQPITTATLPLERINELIERIASALEKGEKLYWICPLVEESTALQLTSIESRFATLYEQFGDCVGMIHGKMPTNEKDAAMASFKCGETRILVATTVIEVGVDIPDASIIVIEHAEHFGLSQLHQLRGRVGRGEKKSSCILLYKGPLTKTAAARLNIMRSTEDGFIIAEEDLRLRGEGELLGTRQSGMPEFHIANLAVHSDLLSMARKDARLFLQRDTTLSSERGKALRLLLYLFKRDYAIQLLRAG